MYFPRIFIVGIGIWNLPVRIARVISAAAPKDLIVAEYLSQITVFVQYIVVHNTGTCHHRCILHSRRAKAQRACAGVSVAEACACDGGEAVVGRLRYNC